MDDEGWLDCDFDDDDVQFVCEKPAASQKKTKQTTSRKRKLISAATSHAAAAAEKTAVSSSELWLYKYKPTTVKEVAGNKAKIEQIYQWLSTQTHQTGHSNNKILLITGPSGCGKTCAVETVCSELSININQWTNQTSDYNESLSDRGDNYVQYESQTKLFDNFLLRANKYQTLQLDEEPSTTNHDKHIVLVEEIPNVYLRNPAEWQNKLRMYIKSARCPLVIIYNTSGSVSDRTLFPETLQSELNITHISFNPVPKTDMRRLLNTISDSELGPDAVRAKSHITSLSESCNGDIRTAVNTLQFTYCQPSSTNNGTQSEQTLVSGSSRKRAKSASTTSAGKSRSAKQSVSEEAPDSLCHKDPTLVIFRALGKVLYCKRKESSNEEESLLPTHITHHSRREMDFNPEQVFEQSKVSSDFYRLCLHQNFPHFFTSIENVRRAVEYLSDSDCLSDKFESRTVTGRAPLGVSIAARGLMHCNTSTSKHGWLPMRKPAWFAANRQTIDNQNIIKHQTVSLTHSSTSLNTDIIPALQQNNNMQSIHRGLSQLIPPLDINTSHRYYSNTDRLDDKYTSHDVNLETSKSYGAEVDSKNKEKTIRVIDEEETILSLDEKTTLDDPDEFIIDDVE